MDFDAPAIRQRYESNSGQALSQIQANPFIGDLRAILSDCSSSYSKNSVRLLMTEELLSTGPVWTSKSFQSVVDKSYRINYLWNRNFPNPPASGWCTPDNLYNQIDDIVRTTIVARYISGAEAIVRNIQEAAESSNVGLRVSRRDSDQGYYGIHVYAQIPLTLSTAQFEPYEQTLDVEMQVTTQLQEALYDLTHSLYEKSRLTKERDRDWKWRYKTPQFKASYAGHALHLIEGMLEELVADERGRD